MLPSAINNIRADLSRLRRRRGWVFLLRRGSVFAAGAALLLLGGSGIALWLQPGWAGGVGIFVGMAGGLAGLLLWLGWGLRRQRGDERRLAHYVEERIPDLEQRLLTSMEFAEADSRPGVSRQFVRELWRDAEGQLRRRREHILRVTPLRAPLLSAGLSAAVLVLTAAAFLGSAGLWEAGGRILWPFAVSDWPGSAEAPAEDAAPRPEIEFSVEPGDVELQRGESLTVTARLRNGAPPAVTLWLQDDRLNWRDYPMQRDVASAGGGAVYSYRIPRLERDSVYYVGFHGPHEPEKRRSPQYRITVFDLPKVERISLRYDYPDYIGRENDGDEDGGDMVLPEGTEVELRVTFNKAVREAVLEFVDFPGDEGEGDGDERDEQLSIALDANGMGNDTGLVRFTVTQDAVYQITATDFSGLSNAEPLQYFIRAIPDAPPELTLLRPGGDREVMPLEEVLLEIEARDDYGLTRFALNYSVAGGTEFTVDFLSPENSEPSPPTHSTAGEALVSWAPPQGGSDYSDLSSDSGASLHLSGRHLIYLEDLAVRPGDFVSYFLTLADNNGLHGISEVISDIYFLQVIPTDQEFRRANGQGGQSGQPGGGQGADSSALVRIQKDIIAATWKLKNRQARTPPREFADDAEIIAESQRQATERARMSMQRLAERLNFSDDSYDTAVENLSLAIERMLSAAAELELQQVTAALQPQQEAMQYILRAEAAINRIEISMQRGGGGGGRAAQREREDLRELFEMELGELENRYETPNSGGSPQQREEMDRLQELARRQEGLTRAQRDLARREDRLSEEQKRRELQRLMRQQEQLARELEQELAQLQQSARQTPLQQTAQPSSQQTPLQQAARQMQEAAASSSASLAAARSQKALENLRRRQRELSQQSADSVERMARDLARRGTRLLQQQRRLQDALAEASREQGLGQTRREVRRAVQDAAGLQPLMEAQQRRQQDIDEIDELLRAVIARGDNEDRRLLSDAQEARRALSPLREEMQTSGRVLRNGMLSLTANLEQDIEEQLMELARHLADLHPARPEDDAGEELRRAVADAQNLREQIEVLQGEVQGFNTGDSLLDMRERLGGIRRLADRLSIRQQISRRDIEDFLSQPELLEALLQPVLELEGELRAELGLLEIIQRVHGAADEDVPEEYRELVQEYYRALSGSGSGSGSAPR